jgi:AraC-like DNA-binding protein/quercetin dioxygenase-like cupin family protein
MRRDPVRHGAPAVAFPFDGASSIPAIDLGGVVVSQGTFRANTDSGDHFHVGAVLAIVLKGSFTEVAEGTETRYGAGTLLLLAPGILHRDRRHSEDAIILKIEIEPDIFSRFAGPAHRPEPVAMALEALAGLPALFCDELRLGDAISRFALRGLVLELTASVLRAARDERHRDPARACWEAVRHVDTHLSRPITLNMVAAALGRPPEAIDRQFQEARGMSLSEYVRRTRIERATEDLVASHLALSKVASRWGFYDQSHFSKEFKKKYGMSPLRYRREANRVDFPGRT